MTDHALPAMLDNVGGLLERYDLLLCDIWGVVHDGRRAFPYSNEALTRFRANGGTVVLVSNSPSPSGALVRLLDDRQVVREAYDATVSSGDLALAHIQEMGYGRIHRIGPAARDGSFFGMLGGPDVAVEEAEAIACTGLVRDREETADQYRGLLERALARKLPFVCVNPDLAVHVGPDLLPCAGAIAAIYEQMGGDVYWAGKPHPVAYAAARRLAERLRGAPVPAERILAVGDSVRTDLAAARNAGVDALFIVSGIHREELTAAGAVSAELVRALLARERAKAVAFATGLRW